MFCVLESLFNSLWPPKYVCVLEHGVIIDSGNGLSPNWRQAITWTNDEILSIWLPRTNFSDISIEIYKFSFKKCISKYRLQNIRHFFRTRCVNTLSVKGQIRAMVTGKQILSGRGTLVNTMHFRIFRAPLSLFAVWMDGCKIPQENMHPGIKISVWPKRNKAIWD